MNNKLSTESYKGVRDFYPEDQAIQNYIFDTWRTVCERYGYEEYNASILEPAELYRSKTNEEIVNEQTYTFTDRGDREVTLRPEMTPTVARMIAGKRRDLGFPVRWYSIPNCFRYERPQRGRVREFWQLNVDIFGVEGIAADIEILSIAHNIMRAFGATEQDFEIRINNRELLRRLIKQIGVKDEDTERYLSLLDKKSKISDAEFKELSVKEFGVSAEFVFDQIDPEIKKLIDILEKKGIRNVCFDGSLIRGFSYYTGMVFEVFDTNPDNPRALFGGGRYDRLLENFGGEALPAVGFGAGDVVMRDFLETRGILPQKVSSTNLMICTIDESHEPDADMLAQTLREGGINVAVYEGTKKLGDQLKIADKKHIPFVVVVGDEEAASQQFKLKNLATGDEQVLDVNGIIDFLRSK